MHGSAPDIAGQDKANPLAMVLSAAMMCRFGLNLPKVGCRCHSPMFPEQPGRAPPGCPMAVVVQGRQACGQLPFQAHGPQAAAGTLLSVAI